jgi:hypothetical protein
LAGVLSVMKAKGRLLGLIGLTMVLVACYPTYNWREVPLANGLAVMAFPGKVESAARELELAGVNVNFVLSGTEVKDTIFSFGYAQLPAAISQAERTAVQRALVDSLALSTGQTPPPEAYAGEAFKLETHANGRSMTLFARALVHHDVAMRVLAWGPSEALTDELGQEFMRSLRLR